LPYPTRSPGRRAGHLETPHWGPAAERNATKEGRPRCRCAEVTDYPSRPSALANPQRDNRRPRRWDPRPSKWGHRTPHSKPTHQEDRSATNVAKLVRRSIDARGRVLDASHRPNRWALDTSPDPATQPGPLSGRSEQALPLIPIRERASRSPAGLPCRAITVRGDLFVPLAGMIAPRQAQRKSRQLATSDTRRSLRL
jgi:hypothetical protein